MVKVGLKEKDDVIQGRLVRRESPDAQRPVVKVLRGAGRRGPGRTAADATRYRTVGRQEVTIDLNLKSTENERRGSTAANASQRILPT